MQDKRLTVCVTCVWAGVDSVWEQENAEARKMLENAAESHTSGARFVRPALDLEGLFCLIILSNVRISPIKKFFVFDWVFYPKNSPQLLFYYALALR